MKEQSKARNVTGEQIPQRTGLVVLGMHRSGTSALAGTLNILGGDLPKTLMPATVDNEKGYFESKKIYQLQKAILHSAGSDWADCLSISPNWFASSKAREFHDQAVAAIEADFGVSRMLVLKDPRICRFVPFWSGVLEELGVDPRFVLTHRNPLEVAASIEKRDGINRHLSLLLWLRHVLDAEIQTRGQPRSFTSYSELMQNWGHIAKKIQSDLQVSLSRFSLNVADEVDAFLSSNLRHFVEKPDSVIDNPMVASWVGDTYAILERWVASGEDKADYSALDMIRQEFDRASPAFARALHATQERLDLLRAERQSLQEAVVVHETVQADLEREVAHLQSQIVGAQEALQQAQTHEARQIKQRDETLLSRCEELAILTQLLDKSEDSLETEIQSHAKQMSRLRDQHRDTEAALEEERRRVERAETVIGEYLASTSWRMTRPVRELRLFLRRVLNW